MQTTLIYTSISTYSPSIAQAAQELQIAFSSLQTAFVEFELDFRTHAEQSLWLFHKRSLTDARGC